MMVTMTMLRNNDDKNSDNNDDENNDDCGGDFNTTMIMTAQMARTVIMTTQQ